MELRQVEVNALASKYGLISNPIETDSDGVQRVILERDEADDRYCQAIVSVSKDGNVFCHTGLYRERAIINNGEVKEPSVEEAVAHAASTFDDLVARAGLQRSLIAKAVEQD